MKTNPKLLIAMLGTLFFAPSFEAGAQQTIALNPMYQADRREAAALRAELMAPTMTRAEAAKVAAVMLARKQRADRELVAYEQFRMDQQLALPEAAASRTNVVIHRHPGNAEKGQPAVIAAVHVQGQADVQAGKTPAAADSASEAAVGSVEVARKPRKTYPARFYRWAAQDESLDKQAAAAFAQSLLGNLQMLLGLPAPGTPEYGTAPAYDIDPRRDVPRTQVQVPPARERKLGQ